MIKINRIIRPHFLFFTFFYSFFSSNALADSECFNPSNINTVGPAGTVCADMLIVSKVMLLEAEEVGNGSDFSISFDGTDYTFGNSANNVFTGQITDFNYIFKDKANFNADIGYWDLRNALTTRFMFQRASSFNQNINSWNVSNVRNMQGMFHFATSFNQDLNSWDVSKVDNLRSIFQSAKVFNGNISSWNTSNVWNLGYAFAEAEAFNSDISIWDTSKVTYFGRTFLRAKEFNQDIGNWDVSKVRDFRRAFQGASKFNQDIGNWDVSSATLLARMFKHASTFNQDLTCWNVKNISSEPVAFWGASKLSPENRPYWGDDPCSKNTTLDNLTVLTGILSPEFDKDELSYSIDYNNSQEEVTFTFSKKHPGATLTVNDQQVLNNQYSDSLNVGINEFKIKITSEDTSLSTEYIISVTREAGPDIVPPEIKNLEVSEDGSQIIIEVSELLNEQSIPPTSNFNVVVDNLSYEVTKTIIQGIEITLSVSKPITREVIEADKNVVLTYSAPTDNSSIKDLSDNELASFKIKQVDNKSTIDITPPELIDTKPSDDMLNVSTQSILNLTFSENINLSSGAIKLYKGNDRSNELIKTFEASPSSGIPTEIKVFENTAEIHLSGYLELSNQYYLLIDPDVFVDGAGNSYSGISRENQFNFSTPSVLLHQYEVGEEGTSGTASISGIAQFSDGQTAAGVMVNLYNSQDVIIKTSITDDTGSYFFDDLSEDTYKVEFVGNSDSKLKGQADSGTVEGKFVTSIEVSEGEQIYGIDAVLIDPAGVIYDSISRQPIKGATVELNFNGDLVDSSWLDLNLGGPNSQITDSDGQYNFILNSNAESGVYSINVIPIDGYKFPSLSIPAELDAYTPSLGGGIEEIQPQDEAPKGSDQTTYYLDINFSITNESSSTSNGIINNHIPLDESMPPLISGPGLEDGTIKLNEGDTLVGKFSSNESVSWILSGEDKNLLNLDTESGDLVFQNVTDFENPNDTDLNNEYLVTITASDNFGNQASISLKIIVEDIIDDLISKVEEELSSILKNDFSRTIETQMAQFSRQSRDSIYRLGTQKKDLDCGPQRQSGASLLNMEDIVIGVIDAVNSNSFSGNYSNEIFNCKNSSMDIIEGNYSITYDKDLGTQLFLGGSSQRDLFVAEDFLSGVSYGGYLQRTNTASSGKGHINGFGGNIGFYQARKFDQLYLNYYVSGSAGYHQYEIFVEDPLETIKTEGAYHYFASFFGSSLSGKVERETFNLRPSIGLDMAIATASDASIKAKQLSTIENGKLDLPFHDGYRWYSEFAFDFGNIANLSGFSNNNQRFEIAPRFYCDNKLNGSGNDCGLGAYFKYSFEDNLGSKIHFQFDYEETDTIKRSNLKFGRKNLILNGLGSSTTQLNMDEMGRLQLEYLLDIYLF